MIMGYSKCVKCGKNYLVDFSNPNLHYSESANKNGKCSHCVNYDNLKKGDWYQNEKGEYLQK